jgi:hypothetical protein
MQSGSKSTTVALYPLSNSLFYEFNDGVIDKKLLQQTIDQKYTPEAITSIDSLEYLFKRLNYAKNVDNDREALMYNFVNDNAQFELPKPTLQPGNQNAYFKAHIPINPKQKFTLVFTSPKLITEVHRTKNDISKVNGFEKAWMLRTMKKDTRSYSGLVLIAEERK